MGLPPGLPRYALLRTHHFLLFFFFSVCLLSCIRARRHEKYKSHSFPIIFSVFLLSCIRAVWKEEYEGHWFPTVSFQYFCSPASGHEGRKSKGSMQHTKAQRHERYERHWRHECRYNFSVRHWIMDCPKSQILGLWPLDLDFRLLIYGF